MKLDGRRTSSNVEDRRRMGGGTVAGMGIGGVAVIALITWLLGGNPADVIQNSGVLSGNTTAQNEQTFTQEEQELATFSSQILASTEEVWAKVLAQYGKQYHAPKMVLYTGSVQTACGGATSQVGPFYCSGDQSLYIDLSFFSSMKKQLGADGDFAYAYVIAHEVGHHVENELGILNQVHAAMNRTNKTEANELSVRLELMADYLAGVWGHYENQRYQSLERGDIEEALVCAEKIGDDYLQKQSYGYSVPESFTHGSSTQREKWLRLGLSTGDLTKVNDLLQLPYSQL